MDTFQVGTTQTVTDPLNVCIVYLELTRFINFFTQHITDYHTFRPNKRCFISRRIIFFRRHVYALMELNFSLQHALVYVMILHDS